VSTARDEQIEEAIREQATHWFVRHREGALTPDERQQYLAWLRASPRHVQAYLNLIALTAKLPEALAGLDIDAEELARQVSQSPHEAERALFRNAPNPPSHSPQHRNFARPALAFAVLIALSIGLGAAAWLTYSAPPSFIAEAGQQRLVKLEDGSTAHLNSGTRLVVRYSDTQRLIELPEGQALFDVTHDVRRPFIVRSGPAEVIALGTTFDVMRRAQRTQVTVVEGKVAVVPFRERSHASFRAVQREVESGAVSANDQPRENAEIVLIAGERVQLADHGGAATPERTDVQLATAWTRKEISFSDEPLAEVVARFSEATGAGITIEDRQLREYRISGVFHAYDVESFLAYLQQFDGVRIERDGDNIRVTR
jgi:transmembrane sensor